MACCNTTTQSLTCRSLTDKHTRILFWATLSSRLWTWTLAALAAQLDLFDSSPLILLPDSDKIFRAALRWDIFHFGSIAHNVYEYEYQWAFFPGTPILMRAMGQLLRLLIPGANGPVTWGSLVSGGTLLAISTSTTRIMYTLSVRTLGSHHLALAASLLALMPSSPATLYFAPGTEPFFTYLSYHGMLSCAYEEWFSAALYFTVAASFRSNGILLAGFIIWGVMFQPFMKTRQLPDTKSVSKAVLATAMIASPFMVYHYAAYRIFCLPENGVEYPWCTNRIPLIYSYVQSTYWNVGFLRYWTLSQAPNLLLAAPVLVLTTSFCLTHLRSYLSAILNSSKGEHVDANHFLRSDLAPYTIHCLLLNLILIFSAHTQIALRFAAATPVTYWAAAWLVGRSTFWGRAWVAWSLVWGAMSTILWVAFLPPA